MSSSLLAQAKTEHKQGNFVNAEMLYLQVIELQPTNIPVMTYLVMLYLAQDRADKARPFLVKLVQNLGDTIVNANNLMSLCDQAKQWDLAADCCATICHSQPTNATAHFNLGYYLSKDHQGQKAILAYEKSLTLGIANQEEVYLNIASIQSDQMHRVDEAIASLQCSLEIDPTYTSAMFNLANLYERLGDSASAQKWFSSVLTHAPNHAEALVRLADLSETRDPRDPLFQNLKRALSSGLTADTRAGIHYALGKLYDQCQDYTEAFSHYQQANKCNQAYIPDYIPTDIEAHIDQLISHFDPAWFSQNRTELTDEPVFICGMFRSGSTLVEQILSSHPEITAGGEQEFLLRLAAKYKNDFLDYLNALNTDDFEQLGSQYMHALRQQFADANIITDKRPDNILYLGLIKTLFPKAKIVYTRRQSLDNCLSVYFAHLGAKMNYATDINSILHYQGQQERLLKHWQSLFPDSIVEVNYDALVTDLRGQIEPVFDLLSLSWVDECNAFYQRKNLVKTASVLQVRQPLYSSSSGRWRHYQKQLAPWLKSP